MLSIYKLCYVLLNTCFSTEHTLNKERPGWPCAWCLSNNRSLVNVCGTNGAARWQSLESWQGTHSGPLARGKDLTPQDLWGSNLEGDQVSLFSSTFHRNWASPLSLLALLTHRMIKRSNIMMCMSASRTLKCRANMKSCIMLNCWRQTVCMVTVKRNTSGGWDSQGEP